jgi:hypothetical protein
MDAHFLGVDNSFNRDYQVYLNILYDLEETAINRKAKHIDFARAAQVIKICVA